MTFLKSLIMLFVRRFVFSAPLIVGASFLSFGILRLGNSNPAILVAGPQADAATINRISEELGLTKPFLEQYFIYLQNLLSGDWGTSWNSGLPVLTDLFGRIPPTLELLGFGLTLGMIGGVTLGFLSAKKQGKFLDSATKSFSLIGVSMPIFWIGLLFISLFTFNLRVFPPPLGRLGLFDLAPEKVTGFYTIDSLIAGDIGLFFKALHYLILPAVTIAVVSGSQILKQARASTLELLNSEGVRFYKSQGMSPRKIDKMILQLASPTIFTTIAMTTIYALAGSALVELIFSWGGLGQWGLAAITSLDYAVVQAYVLTLAIASAIIFLILDVFVALVDKRKLQ
jgi:peptide/nickel transport system permease protein